MHELARVNIKKNTMFQINTFVFFDIETTGLPKYEFRPPTKITELALTACSREHLLATEKNELPRVLHKILLPIQPRKCILPESTEITGLDNFLLERVATFNEDTVGMMNLFVNRLEKPVCLVAHNGNGFDYPLLREHCKRINCFLPEHLLCVDSLGIFKEYDKTLISNSITDEFLKTDLTDVQKINEKTPSRGISKYQKRLTSSTDLPKSSRRLFSNSIQTSDTVIDSPTIISNNSTKNERVSYKLCDIFERLHYHSPETAHNAEADTMHLLKCAIAINEQFVQLADRKAAKFSEF